MVLYGMGQRPEGLKQCSIHQMASVAIHPMSLFWGDGRVLLAKAQ